MKKSLLLSFLAIALLATSCNKTSEPEPEEIYGTDTITHVTHKGEIGDFALLAPENNFVTNTGFTFSWEAADNADYYALEIASTLNFISDDEDEVYVRESNIAVTCYDLNFVLPKKDIIYYWRVTANNSNKSKKSEIGHFVYQSNKISSIDIEIEDEQDWAVHKEGSQATVSIDRNNFFGNNKNSLVIKFDMEHTKQGIPSSDGWIVITKTQDTELYGTDAFYFNFFYAGHDSTILIRVLDYDGEYWHNQVQVSRNSKQTVLMKYEDFQLRTAGTNINNRVFDWEHIRYFEIVFERTFGDGVCILSDIKAVNYSDYRYMFMDKMDFKTTDPSTWTYENFDFDKEISESGDELTISWKAKSEANPNGFSGYGYQSVHLYKYLVQGDALRMKVKYTGCSSTSIFFFRVLEEDNDRWQFKTPFTYLIKDEYKELIIPLKALQRMEYMNGDGAKQFYFIQKFNFGLSNNYASGSISIKDLEVIKISDVVSDRTRKVAENGMIENFENYDIYTQIYYYWDQSFENKDEAMKLDTIHKTGGLTNKYCAEFDYKADMEMAVYQLYLDTSAIATSKNAFSLWVKDAAVKPDNPNISYLPDEDVAGEMIIQLTMDSGEWYRYSIKKMPKDWRQYTILFSEFECINERDLFDEINPLSSEHIIHMAFGFQYFYYDKDGKPYPTYAIANPVYLDEIKFATAASSSIEEIGSAIKMDEEDPNKAVIDNMESYITNDDVFGGWQYGSTLEYNSITTSSNVSSEGDSRSLKMGYKGATSVSYVRPAEFDSSVKAKGFVVDIKSDGKATIYLNLNWRSGTTLYKMRYVLQGAASVWTRYEIGFSLFKDIDGSNKYISLDTAKNIESFSLGITNGDNSNSEIYIDNITLRKDCASYSVFKATTLA